MFWLCFSSLILDPRAVMSLVWLQPMNSYEELGILHSSPWSELRLENDDEFFQSVFN